MQPSQVTPLVSSPGKDGLARWEQHGGFSVLGGALQMPGSARTALGMG